MLVVLAALVALLPSLGLYSTLDRSDPAYRGLRSDARSVQPDASLRQEASPAPQTTQLLPTRQRGAAAASQGVAVQPRIYHSPASGSSAAPDQAEDHDAGAAASVARDVDSDDGASSMVKNLRQSSSGGTSNQPGASPGHGASGRGSGREEARDAQRTWQLWRRNGTLALVRLHAARARVVTMVGSSDGGDAAAVAASTGPMSLAGFSFDSESVGFVESLLDGASPHEPSDAVEDATGGVTAAACGGPAANIGAQDAADPSRASVARQVRNLNLTTALPRAPEVATITPGGGALAGDVEDTDVLVFDVPAMRGAGVSPSSFEAMLRGFGPRAMLHTLVIGLPCDDNGESADESAQWWRAVDSAMWDGATEPKEILRPDAPAEDGVVDHREGDGHRHEEPRAPQPGQPRRARRLQPTRTQLFDRVNYFCDGAPLTGPPSGSRSLTMGSGPTEQMEPWVRGTLAARTQHAGTGVAVLSRRPLWPSLAHGWRAVRFPKTGSRALPRTLDPRRDLLVAHLDFDDRTTFVWNLLCDVPTSCARHLGTPFQTVAVVPSQAGPELRACYLLDKLPTPAAEAASIDVKSFEAPLPTATVSSGAEAPGGEAGAAMWSDTETGPWQSMYTGHFCGATVLALHFTPHAEVFLPIAQPLAASLWDRGVPTMFHMRETAELPGLHVTMYMTEKAPRRYIAWQMEYSERLHWALSHKYLGASEAIWQYTADNLDEVLAIGREHGKSVTLVTPCYHESIELDMPKPVEPLGDLGFLGSLGPSGGRRRELLKGLRDLGSLGVWHYKLGAEFVYFANMAEVVVNVHAYDRATLETTRLIPLLANEVFVVSEDGVNKATDDKLRSGLVFVPQGDETALHSAIARHQGARNAALRQQIAERGHSIVATEFHCAAQVDTLWGNLRQHFPRWVTFFDDQAEHFAS